MGKIRGQNLPQALNNFVFFQIDNIICDKYQYHQQRIAEQHFVRHSNQNVQIQSVEYMHHIHIHNPCLVGLSENQPEK